MSVEKVCHMPRCPHYTQLRLLFERIFCDLYTPVTSTPVERLSSQRGLQCKLLMRQRRS